MAGNNGAMPTALTLEAPPLPLKEWPDGSIRVGDTRVTLPVLLAHYLQGYSPERLAAAFDTLALPDVYAVIAWYWRNKEAADAYLAEHARAGDSVRSDAESAPKYQQFKSQVEQRRQSFRGERT